MTLFVSKLQDHFSEYHVPLKIKFKPVDSALSKHSRTKQKVKTSTY